MAVNIFKNNVPDPNLKDNPFDLSYRVMVEANAGELLPIFCRYALPGDKFRLRVADLVRANAFVSAPFIRVKQHYDFYFVPKAAIWRGWLNFQSQKPDYRTAQDFAPAVYHPFISASNLASKILHNYNTTDFIGRPYLKGARRLMSLLGYGDTAFNQGHVAVGDPAVTDPLLEMSLLGQSGHAADYSINLDRIAAYNMIWYHFYRNKWYDDGTWKVNSQAANITNPAELWNFDDLQCSNLNNANINNRTYPHIQEMFQMRYHQWKKDLFTGLMPSTQFGAVSKIDMPIQWDGNTSNDVGKWQTWSGTDIPSQKAVFTGNGSGSGNSLYSDSNYLSHSHTYSISGGLSFDILELRRQLAIQKYNEISLRAGSRMGDNQQAHTGHRPHFNDGLLPQFLGSLSAPLNISDIDATAATSASINGNVGDVAGKGIMSFDGEAFKFSSNDDGILIGIYYILPEAEYNSRGIDRENCLLEHDDFFEHEFQNIGMEAVSAINFDFRKSDKLLGYAPRYYAYKTAYDKVTGQFQNDHDIEGNLSHWVSPRYRTIYNIGSSLPYLDASTLYVDPAVLDRVFNSSVDGWNGEDEYASNFDNYQFFVNMYHDCRAIREMSVLGLPEI